MKTLFKALLVGIFLMMAPVWTSSAQIVLPNENPRSVLTQEIGLSTISFEYTRPGTQGHIIFGERVPFGERWLTNNELYVRATFNDQMILDNGEKLPAGTYAIEAIPNESQWVIIFKKGEWKQVSIAYQDKMQYLFEGDTEPYFTSGKEIARISVTPQKMKEQVESFTIQLANVCATCAQVQLMWDYTRVQFGISTEVDEAILNKIEQFTAHPELKLAGQYYLAAKYYFDTNRDLDQALEWINKSLELAPDAYWVMHTKAEILASQGNYKEAMNIASESKKLAEEKEDVDYVRINEEEIERWKMQKKGDM